MVERYSRKILEFDHNLAVLHMMMWYLSLLGLSFLIFKKAIMSFEKIMYTICVIFNKYLSICYESGYVSDIKLWGHCKVRIPL